MQEALKDHLGQLKKFYGEDAPNYDEDRFGGPSGRLYDEAHFSALQKMLRQAEDEERHTPRKVLDIATGTGRTIHRLAAVGYRAFGLDITPEMLQVAQKKNKRSEVNLLCGDAFALPFSAATFDAVICCRMLQMIPRDFYPTFGRQAERILKPGGILVVELWNQAYRRIRHLGRNGENSRGMRDTFIHPGEREGLFGLNYKVEQTMGLGFPLLLRLGGSLSPRSSLGLYAKLSQSCFSRHLGETMLVQYRKLS